MILKETSALPDDAYIGDDRLALLLGRHNIYNLQLERAQKIAQTQEATGKGVQAQAEATLAQAKVPGATAESTIQQQQAALTPQQRALAGNLPYAAATGVPGAQQAVNLETEQKRQAAIAQVQAQSQMYAGNAALAKVPPHLVAPATADAQKAASDYADTLSAADDMNTFINMARSGNKVAYAYAPTEGVLTFNTARGVKRVNMAEIGSYAGAGSAADRVAAFLGKATKGASIPGDVLNDMQTLHDAIAQNALGRYQNKLKSVNQNYGSNFTPVQMDTSSRGGGQVQVRDPQGGIHTFADQAAADRFKKLAGRSHKL